MPQMTHILAEDIARCAPETAAQKLQMYFSRFAASGDAVRYELAAPFDQLNLPNIGQFSRDVDLSLGKPSQRQRDTLLPLRWSPSDAKLLPAFEGFIEITPLSSTEVQLAVIGEYDPPLGLMGDAFDGIVGRKIADATIAHLLSQLKTAVELPA